MNILITGGCGFLGSNLAEKVIKRGHDTLYLLDNFHRLGSKENLNWLKTIGEFTFFEADVRHAEEIARIVAQIKPDIIFHLAGQVAMTTSIANPRLDFEINVLGTINVLEAVRQHAPQCIITYSSSNKVYGELDWVQYDESSTRYTPVAFPNGLDENAGLDFRSPYGCSKGAADQYALDYHRIYGLNTVVFRHSSLYGNRQFSTIDQGWIGWFCQKAIEAKKGDKTPFTISGTGKQVRDVLHADDMTELYLSVPQNIKRMAGQAFNIGGGMPNSLSLLELFAMLEERLNVKLSYTHLPWRASDQKVFVADITKCKSACGWQPKISKETGIDEMLKWVEQIG